MRTKGQMQNRTSNSRKYHAPRPGVSSKTEMSRNASGPEDTVQAPGESIHFHSSMPIFRGDGVRALQHIGCPHESFGLDHEQNPLRAFFFCNSSSSLKIVVNYAKKILDKYLWSE